MTRRLLGSRLVRLIIAVGLTAFLIWQNDPAAILRETGAEVVLLGMRIPPNYGPEYAEEFAALYPRIAGDLDVPLVPFLLAGVGGEPGLNLPDGIHPNAQGHERVADNVVPPLREALGGGQRGEAGAAPGTPDR